MTAILNILRNAIRPGYAREMVNKVVTRWRERGAAHERKAVRAWCIAHTKAMEAWAAEIDAGLWNEACEFSESQARHAKERMAGLTLDFGGGGAYHLIYFLTRLLRPGVVIETGVAAGFSSRAFLRAMEVNGRGRLLSSDFPYFRVARPERYVGYLVEDRLRTGWTLLLKGDRQNLPDMMSAMSAIDLFHYDSDKSYAGRAFAYQQVAPLLSEEAVVIFDDVQDNWYFRDLVRDQPFRVFEFEGKWVGLTGGPARLYAAHAK